jgi:hypothetical protein
VILGLRLKSGAAEGSCSTDILASRRNGAWRVHVANDRISLNAVFVSSPGFL